jgi:hypothetical protein
MQVRREPPVRVCWVKRLAKRLLAAGRYLHPGLPAGRLVTWTEERVLLWGHGLTVGRGSLLAERALLPVGWPELRPRGWQ